MRRAPPTSRRKASISTTSSSSTKACSWRTRRYKLLTEAPWPARAPNKNIADLKAQVAANAKGVSELGKMVAHFGARRRQGLHGPRPGQRRGKRPPSACRSCPMASSASRWTRAATSRSRSPSTSRRAPPRSISPAPARPSPTTSTRPRPVTRAAVLYVFRVMVDEPIPMNAGCLKPIEIVIPEGSMLSPDYPAAVIAGNVETSQIVTNCLFGALGAMGPSQGTMNNLIFGNDVYQYYETICSGSPAGPGLQRHRRGPRPHDQHAPDRPRDPGTALPRGSRGILDPPRLRRQGQVVGRRRHLPQASASCAR